MKLLLFIFSLILYLAASAGELSISTIPKGATISLIDKNGDDGANLGTTPFIVDIKDLIGQLDGGKVGHLVIAKKGHKRERILMVFDPSENYELTLKLEVRDIDHKVEYVDTFVSTLFDVQKMIRVKDYDSALNVLAQLESDYPYYSIVPEIKGSVQYLGKNFKESLGSYRKAVGLNPKNYDAYRMKIYLEKYAGLKKREQ